MRGGKFILIVNNASDNILRGVDELFRKGQDPDLRVLLLTNDPSHFKPSSKWAIPVDVVPCDFAKVTDIVKAISPFKEHIQGVVCAGERHIQFLRKVVPHLPAHVLVASSGALLAATDKHVMRQAFARHTPEITPRFVKVDASNQASIDVIESRLRYPVIVKPTNLASSLLVQSCDNRQELVTAVASIFGHIQSLYKREGRVSQPNVIVEEYLDGDFYSIDAYAMGKGKVYFCPPVGYVPAKKLGIDDFFLYKRFTPTELTAEQIAAANKTVAKAVAAVGLTHSSVHAELVNTSAGWKIIEIGPRLGRFRHLMYGAAYNINHYLNDVLIHMGQEPIIKTQLQQYCAGYIIYPEVEGILRTMEGIAELQDHPATLLRRVFAKPGDQCLHAKHGGRALAEFVVASKDKASFHELTNYIEQYVKAVVE